MLRIVQLAGFESPYPGSCREVSNSGSRWARALVVESEILLLDEPLSNLDANLREEMRFEIRHLHDVEDLFRRPRTRFVVEFIGRTNLLDAVAGEAGIATRGSLLLRVAAHGVAPGTCLTVSIRPPRDRTGRPGTPPTGRGEHRRGHDPAHELSWRRGRLSGACEREAMSYCA
jgi:iron(III) transport system ATP-binding protein